MTTLHAQPYDITASGFYFTTATEYADKAAALRNDYGQPVEEFEIQFIQGHGVDAQLFEALAIHQGDVAAYFEAVDDWSEDDKITVIIAVGDGGYDFDLGKDRPDKFDITLYQVDTMRDLAEQFVDEGYFGEIPKALESYIDYDAIARDLRGDFAETMISGNRYIYRLD